jgi:BolA protein
MSIADSIAEKLKAAFQPQHLAVIDDSARHQGHAGARPEGETHFRLELVSPVFHGLPRIERHRRVNDLLAEERDRGLHALSMAVHTPEEWSQR